MTETIARDQARKSLSSIIPVLNWLPQYQRSWLRGDIVAALTVWALLVPEAMAYAGIAGMPPQAGLYAAPLALIAYAIFGTSRHLNVGPSSAVAALSFTVVSGIALAGSEEFILLTIALALMVGIFLIIGGILRLGVLADFLSRPVLDGFVVGVAIHIAVGQFDKLLGFEPEGADIVPEMLLILGNIGMTDLPTLAVGLVSLLFLFVFHKYAPKLPGALVVLFLAIAASSLFDFEALGIHVVGDIPTGLPPFGFPEELGLAELLAVAPGAVGVALVAYAESVAIARAYSNKYGYEVDANKEMIAVGASNIGSGFSAGFVVNGSMSRTAASEGAGGKTQMVAIVAAVAILITAAALTPLFYNLPEATLGAIVIHAVWKNINLHKVSQYQHITNLDFATAVVAMIGVLLLGLLAGLLLASFLGLLVLLIGTKQRNTAVLGKVPNSTVYSSLDNYPDGKTYPGLLILRFDGTLFYANTPNFLAAIRRAIATAEPPPKVILLDGESMNGIDATAVISLKELQEQLTRSGIEIRLARMKSEVMAVIERAGLPRTIPEEHYYPSVQAGVDAYLAEFRQNSTETDTE